jgi:hypothetical protein
LTWSRRLTTSSSTEFFLGYLIVPVRELMTRRQGAEEAFQLDYALAQLGWATGGPAEARSSSPHARRSRRGVDVGLDWSRERSGHDCPAWISCDRYAPATNPPHICIGSRRLGAECWNTGRTRGHSIMLRLRHVNGPSIDMTDLHTVHVDVLRSQRFLCASMIDHAGARRLAGICEQ